MAKSEQWKTWNIFSVIIYRNFFLQPRDFDLLWYLATGVWWQVTDLIFFADFEVLNEILWSGAEPCGVQGAKPPTNPLWKTILSVNRCTNGEIWTIKDMKYILMMAARAYMNSETLFFECFRNVSFIHIAFMIIFAIDSMLCDAEFL
jgi:hypothetical protein